MIRLTAPNGATVSVADEKAPRLLAQGFHTIGAVTGGAPRGNASRGEWAAYAASFGIEVPEAAKRDDIKVLISAHAAGTQAE